MNDLTQVAEALKRRNFEVEICNTPAEACDRIESLATGARTIAAGGCATLKDLGAIERLKAKGLELLPHGSPAAQVADVYFLSANALLADGRIVNIDGTCNRVSASLYGPKQVVFVIGRNKIVQGGIDDAIARIKRETCPKNARRLGRKTPCATTGCTDCNAPDRMCNVTVIFDRKPTRTATRVLLVDAEIGF